MDFAQHSPASAAIRSAKTNQTNPTKSLRHCLTLAALILALPAFAEDNPATPAQRAVRQRFVPKPRDARDGNGADCTKLNQMKMDKPGVLMLMAHAGVGDSFPVGEKDLRKALDVTVLAGDDDHLKLGIRIADEKKQQLDVDMKRDGTVSMQLAGHKFTFAYPSVTVNPDSSPTTDKAMIIVNRFP